MEYEVFKQHIRDGVEAQTKKGGKVLVNHIIKNNGRELDGLVILDEGCNVAPTIYLNSYYEQYQDGRKISDIIKEIINIHKSNKDNLKFASDMFNDYNNVKDKVVYKVINYDKNSKLLLDVPHRKMLDLAIVYYCLLEQDKGISATALIHNSHLKSWNITEEELYEDAIINTPKLLKSCIRPMSAVLREMIEIDDDDDNDDKEERDTQLIGREGEMYVLTNENRVNGAACMLYEKVLDKFADLMQADLYILPSSVHEVIILPKQSTYDKKMLQDMVREVNVEGVAADEVLSDNVYEYSRKDRMIKL